MALDRFFRSGTLTDIARVGVRLALIYRVDPFVMLSRPPEVLFRLHELTHEVSEDMKAEGDV